MLKKQLNDAKGHKTQPYGFFCLTILSSMSICYVVYLATVQNTKQKKTEFINLSSTISVVLPFSNRTCAVADMHTSENSKLLIGLWWASNKTELDQMCCIQKSNLFISSYTQLVPVCENASPTSMYHIFGQNVTQTVVIFLPATVSTYECEMLGSG